MEQMVTKLSCFPKCAAWFVRRAVLEQVVRAFLESGSGEEM